VTAVDAAIGQHSILARMSPLTFGHGTVDLTQGAIPALLPLFVDRFSLSYAAAATLIFALTVTSSVTQPVFGYFADRAGLVWVLPVAVALSGLGVALASLAGSFVLVFLSVMVAGLGIAAYHPEGARVARAIAHDDPAHGMALFSVGGNVGIALGPALAALCTGLFGLAGGVLLAIPAAIATLVLSALLPRFRAVADLAVRRAAAAVARPDRPRALAMLLTVVTLRGYVFFVLLGFVPLYETQVRDMPEARGQLLLTVFLACGAIGTLVMGRFAGRFGLRRSMAVSFLAVGPLIALYVVNDGPAGVIALGLAGAGLISTFSVSVVLCQDYLPSRASTAAGLGFGLSIGVGGMLAPVGGLISDHYGLAAGLMSAAVVALAGAAVTFAAPDE
jgi:FSR family fosmidomycin resistance protein-like MFS transporter